MNPRAFIPEEEVKRALAYRESLRSLVLAGNRPTLATEPGRTSPISPARQEFGPTHLAAGGLLQTGSRGKPVAWEMIEGQTLGWLSVERRYMGRQNVGRKDVGVRAEDGEEE